MSRETNGVALIGRILSRVASDEHCTAVSLVEELGAARTTTFEVLRRLEAAGFLDRDAQGRVSPGQAGADLGFAIFGIVKGAGVSEALLPVLRDDSDASVELVLRQGRTETVLVRRTAPGSAGKDAGSSFLMEEPVAAAGVADAFLRLTVRSHRQAPDRSPVRPCLKAVADALSVRFARSGNDHDVA